MSVGGLVILVSWHVKATAYHCQKCGYEFEISMLTDFFNPNGVDKGGAGSTKLFKPIKNEDTDQDNRKTTIYLIL